MNASPPTTSTPAAGTKRKRDSPPAPKFYAVRIGKTPGIYHSWTACKDQVTGFPKAAFKSFTSLTEAKQFLNGVGGTGGASGGNGGDDGAVGGLSKWYGVQCGRKPGVYTTWPEVLEQITGWKVPKHRVFKTRAEAETYVAEGGQTNGRNGIAKAKDDAVASTWSTHSHSLKTGSGKKGGAATKDKSGPPPAMDEQQGEYVPGEGPLPPDATDNFDPTITIDHTHTAARYKTASELSRTKYQAVGPVSHAPVRIYTDGSSLSNGQAGAIGGVGVHFGPRDRRNISEPLTGTKQTNQRAELMAILRALEVAPRDRNIEIFTDSRYAIDCVTRWFRKWRQNNWHNVANRPVENKDLVAKVIDLLEERFRHRKPAAGELSGSADAQQPDQLDAPSPPENEVNQPWFRGPYGVKFIWVKGHDKDAGNTAADALAVNGARLAKALVADDVVFDDD